MEIIELYKSIKRNLEIDRGNGHCLDDAFKDYNTLLYLLRKDGYDVSGHYSELSRIRNDIKMKRYDDAYDALLSDFFDLPITFNISD